MRGRCVCSLSGPAECGNRRRGRPCPERKRLTDKRLWVWCCRCGVGRTRRGRRNRSRRLVLRRTDRAKPGRKEKAAAGSKTPANTQSTWNGRSGHRKPPLIILPRADPHATQHTQMRGGPRTTPTLPRLTMHAFTYDTRRWRGLEVKVPQAMGRRYDRPWEIPRRGCRNRLP
jgi:hypothetical protein